MHLLQNSELLTEGELRSNIDESDRVRDLQDKVADLKAEVCVFAILILLFVWQTADLCIHNNKCNIYSHIHTPHTHTQAQPT